MRITTVRATVTERAGKEIEREAAVEKGARVDSVTRQSRGKWQAKRSAGSDSDR